jgi:hypothetical protein
MTWKNAELRFDKIENNQRVVSLVSNFDPIFSHRNRVSLFMTNKCDIIYIKKLVMK